MGYRFLLVVILAALVIIPPIISLTVRPKKAKDNKPAQLTAIGLGVFFVAFCLYFFTWGVVTNPFIYVLIRVIGMGGGIVLAVAGAVWSIIRYYRR